MLSNDGLNILTSLLIQKICNRKVFMRPKNMGQKLTLGPVVTRTK